MQSTYGPMFAALLGQAPMLLAHLIGLVLCIVWRRKSPRAAMLALIGTLLNLSVLIVFPVVQMYLLTARNSTGSSMEQVSLMLAVLGLIASLIRVAGYLLLIAAVFSERAPVERSIGFPMSPTQASPPPLRL